MMYSGCISCMKRKIFTNHAKCRETFTTPLIRLVRSSIEDTLWRKHNRETYLFNSAVFNKVYSSFDRHGCMTSRNRRITPTSQIYFTVILLMVLCKRSQVNEFKFKLFLDAIFIKNFLIDF